MSKVDGIKLVRVGGAFSLQRTMAAWDERELSRIGEARQQFEKDVIAHLEGAAAHEEDFTNHLKVFWSGIPRGTRVSKLTIVNMVTTAMISAGLFQIGEMVKVMDLFGNFLDANTGEPGSGAWMEAKREGRNGSGLKELRRPE